MYASARRIEAARWAASGPRPSRTAEGTPACPKHQHNNSNNDNDNNDNNDDNNY